jgi:molecular chaperone HtpG
VQNRPELIGQFGVGFYASFMVADRVTVLSRPAGAGGAADGVKWESDGQGEFTVEPVRQADARNRRHPAPPRRRQGVPQGLAAARRVKRYSDYIEHPIVMEVDGKEETLNSRQAIWLRPKNELKAED